MMNQSTYELIFLKDTSFTKNNVYIIVDKSTQAAAIIDPACDLCQITDVILKRNVIIELNSGLFPVRQFKRGSR